MLNLFFITRMLVSTNLLNNYIGAEQAENLVAILKQHVKQLIEKEIGWNSELTVLMHADCGDELSDDHTLAQFAVDAAIELCARQLRRVVVAEHLGIEAYAVTDAQLNETCTALAAEPLDILDLSGCSQIGQSQQHPSHLPQLCTVSVLCMSECESTSGDLLLTCLQGMPALTVNV